MTTTKLHLNSDWKIFLKEELNSNNFKAIISELEIERKNHTIFPENDEIFNAFNQTSLDDLKVVILGQDAYHTKAKNGVPLANGLCFSVPNDCGKCPPSLTTIFKELKTELALPIRLLGT